MKIGVLSGKGGTGKTFVSVNLASSINDAVYVDCDVEEPNGNLFLKSENIRSEDIKIKLPEVDYELCNGCRLCSEFCKFNALAYVGSRLMIFEDVCHSCGGCMLLCPNKAISEKEKSIGRFNLGKSEGVMVLDGILNVGEESGTPVISKVLNEVAKLEQENIVIDCPPGSACMVMDSIKHVDFCVLVAEPTIFGRHNLEMVYELVTLMGKPCGVVLNKCTGEVNPSEEFCKDKGIKILGKIKYNKKLGEINSNGEIISRKIASYREIFIEIFEKIKRGSIKNETVISS